MAPFIGTVSKLILAGSLTIGHRQDALSLLNIRFDPSSGGFEQWASGIGRSRLDPHGKMDIRRALSVRFDGTVLIMSWCLASGTFATCWDRTKDITMTLALTCR